MLSDPDVKILAKMHPRNKKPACSIQGDIAVVHSPFFVLEVPKQQVKVTEWPGDPYPEVTKWRTEQIPQGVEGSKAQVMRETWEEEKDADDEPLSVVKLQTDETAVYVQKALYDLFDDQLDSPEFRVYPGTRDDGTPHMIGVFNDAKLVGAVAPILRDSAE